MIDIKVKNRIEWICKNQINDFAPTISPAPKSIGNREIESIEEAVRYFAENQVEEIVVQKKYMGSYCSIYLKENLSETYFVSRNGYKIEHIDLEKAICSLKPLHEKLSTFYPHFDTIILASELMPWNVLGHGLIDKEYQAYYDALDTNNSYLSQSDLYDKVSKIQQSEAYKEYLQDKERYSTKELKVKYKMHIIRQYDALQDLVILDLDAQRTALNVFKKQLEIYGQQGDIYFRPFLIQKIVQNNGSEILPNSNLTYRQVNEDLFLHVRIDNDHIQESISSIYDFFKQQIEDNEEGIMIKPVQSYIPGIVPCFKIRNNHYLTMIYGVNFNMDFDYYLSKRNIRKKMEQSIHDWELNQQMIQLLYHEINEENYKMKLLILKRIQNEEIEKTLDSRL